MKSSFAVRPLAAVILAASALTSAGCAHRPQSLYEWGSYQAQVYEHFKATSSGAQDQLLVLEQDLEKIRAHGTTPPPGYHAHMGMLYASLGRDDQAVQAFQSERALFPESAKYLDFLMAKAKTKK